MSKLTRTERDLPSLTVLALLSQGPRHTYDMHREMVQTHKDFVAGLPRSLYNAVDRLEGRGLVVVAGMSREGNRPERTVYQITPEGQQELVGWVRRLVEAPDRNTTLFVAALSFLGCLPVADAREALRTRYVLLDRHRGDAQRELRDLRQHLPRLLLIEVEYEADRIAAEARWVQTLLSDLDSGDLSWPADLRDWHPHND